MNRYLKPNACFRTRGVALACRLILGVVFLAASWDKMLHPADFAEILYSYQILPEALVNPAAIILPWVEALLGVLLIAGKWWLPGAALLSNFLMAAFIGALLFNLARGFDVNCGCFSTRAEAGPMNLWTVIRDLAFLALSVILLVNVMGGTRAAAVTSDFPAQRQASGEQRS